MEDLVIRAKDGDKEAYNMLVLSLKEELYRIAKAKINEPEDIKDILQDTFLLGYLNISQLKNNKNFKQWLIKILINQCNNFYKNNNRNKELNNKYLSSLFNENEYYSQEYNGEFDNLLDVLDIIEQEIFKLYYEEKYTVSEISEKLRINKNTIKSKLSRGRKKIKHKYYSAMIGILIIFVIAGGVVFGKDLINYLKSIFDLSDFGDNNEGVLTAIEQKNWVQNIDLPYIQVNENESLRISYLLMDDINMYIVFDLKSKQDLGKYDRFTINDLKITLKNGEILYYNANMSLSQMSYTGSWKKVKDSSNQHLRELLIITCEDFSEFADMNISFSEIILYNNNNPSKYANKIITESKNAHIDIEEKFINRDTTKYVSKNSDIQKAVITETGFYTIIKSNNIKINAKLYAEDKKYKCNINVVKFDTQTLETYFLIYADIDLTKSYDKFLLEVKNEKIELYKE